MKTSFFRKIITFVSIFSIVAQSLTPYLVILPQSAYAQETPVVEETTPPAEEPAPTVEQTQPTETVEATPIPEKTVEVIPVPIEDPSTQTPTPTDNPSPPSNDGSTTQDNSNPSENNQTPTEEQPTITTVEEPVTITPEQEGLQTTGEENLNLIVLDNASAPSIDLDAVEESGSAVLTTDKPDYAPTDTALITGTNLLPNTQYLLKVWSDDEPPTGVSVQVTSDENGVFAYAYQLDGTYRPNYSAELKDSEGNVVAAVTFTDSAFICQNDVDGANDEPGQKDLTRMCSDSTQLPTKIDINWDWDDSTWSGGNTGDGCSLFDTDNDGNANYALCVTVGGSPATFQSKTLYSCSDNKTDRCQGPTSIAIGPNTNCSASVQNSDPFLTGDFYPADTVANCSLSTSDIGGVTTAKLIDVCSYPSQQPNSDPSDCIIATAADTGTLEIKKILSPSDDQGLFNLSINGSVMASDVGNNGTTGDQIVLAGSNTFSESEGTGTSLSNYTTSVVCKEGNGTGATVSTTGTNPWTISVVKNKDILCTITNTRNTGSVNAHKLVDADGNGTYEVNTNAGANALGFTWSLDGSGTNAFGTAVNNVNTGNHNVNENSVSGYHFVGWYLTSDTSTTCANTTNTTLPSSVAVTNGQTTNITLCNQRDTGTVVVHKDVQGPDGENIVDTSNNFTVQLDATGSQVVTDNGTATYNNVPTGNHTVTESVIPSGYSLYGISTTQGAAGNLAGLQVSVTTGQTTHVYVTNRQQTGTVTVVKDVLNPDSGPVSDSHSFTTNLNPGNQSDSFAEGDNTVFTVNPGSYTVTENGDPDYDEQGCKLVTGADATGFNVAPGGQVTVTCTNKQKKATITVEKDVVKSDGSAVDDNHLFQVTLNSETKDLSEQTDAVFTVNPGQYSAAESADANYTEFSNDSPKTVASNGSATIHIVNKQNPGTISGTKFDENQNVLSGWTINLFRCTALGIDCTTFLDFAITDQFGNYSFINLITGFYSVVEVMQNGWTNVADLFHDITINPGSNVTDQDFVNQGDLSITVCKYEDSNGPLQGGSFAGVNNWDFTLSGEQLEDDILQNTDDTNCTTFSDLKPGTYSVTELPLPDGWFVADDSQGSRQVVLNDESELVNFFNYRKGSLTVIKNVDINADGDFDDPGELGATDWEWKLDDGDNLVTGTTQSDIDPNTYLLSEIQQPGFHVTDLTCDNISHGATESSEITINSNQDVTCTFTNRRDSGTITVDKVTDPSEDETLFDINLTQSETTVHTSTLSDTNDPDTYQVLSGTYSLSEVSQTGWDLTNVSCIDSDQSPVNPNEFTVANEDEIFCTFTNTKRGSVIVTKFLDENANGVLDQGEEVLGDWDINLTNEDEYDETETTDETNGDVEFGNLVPGSYTLSEAIKDGWKQSNIFCSNEILRGDFTGLDNLPFPLIFTDNDNEHGVNVGAGQTVNCWIGNYEDAVIIVTKVVLDPDDQPVSEDTTEFEFNVGEVNTFNLSNGEEETTTVTPGEYDVTETLNSNYEFLGCEAVYDGEETGIQNDGGVTVSVDSGDEVTVTCTNKQEEGEVFGTKWNDLNGNAERDCEFIEEDEVFVCEPVLERWVIFADENENSELDSGEVWTTTDVNGQYTLALLPGEYRICEVIQAGWEQTYPNNVEETICHNVVISGDSGLEGRDFGNHNQTPIITISKENNTLGADKEPGDTVGYTITLNISGEGGPATNVQVTDLLPEGFIYVAGSRGASSAGHGDLFIPEPTYASPGVWNLVDTTNGNTAYIFQPGDTIILTYSAKIDGSQATGIYPDNAWGQATSVGSSDPIFATAVNEGDLGLNPDNFVGTEVSIINPNQPGVDYKVTSTREVLGASTFLPATGEDTLWVIIATLMLGLGFGTIVTGYRLKKKYE